jgi:hypothetical protein
MKRTLTPLTLIVVSMFVTLKVLAACGSYFQPHEPDTFAGGPYPSAFSKTAHWDLFFTDGHVQNNPPVNVTEPGAYFNDGALACYPGYDEPIWQETTVGVWNQQTHAATEILGECVYNAPFAPIKNHRFTYHCKAHCGGQTDFAHYTSGCIGGFVDSGDGTCGKPQWFQDKCWNGGETYSGEFCRCDATSPIIIDVNGDGFSLTDAAGGVHFDLDANGIAEQLSWTATGSDDAFLVLDRNANGIVDDGQELFGNFTTQPAAPEGQAHNGFIALGLFDNLGSGGNGDGKINKADSVFAGLKLWQDINHNGFSEPGELHALNELGVKTIELDYKISKRTDQYGNRFRFKAKVKGSNDAQLGRWAWDVIFVTTH